MAVKTCEEVLNGPSYAGDGGKQVTRDSDMGNEDSGDFLDAVIKAAGTVDKAAAGLYQYDCSNHLMEWIYSVCPSLKTVGKNIDSVVNSLNSISTGTAISDFIQGNTVTKAICNVIVTVFGNVTAWLEMLSKAAFALFDKIDAARVSMQSALQSLNGAVLNCILDVYNMIEKYLTGLLKTSLEFNWNGFEGFLRSCPCICRFVAYVTGCDTDDEGNNISNDPDKIVTCIREKFWFMEGANLALGLSMIMDDYIKKYIVLFFDAIDLGLESLFLLFIKPFRQLIKQYADFLRKRWDVGFLIEPLKASHLDCLLTYRKEVEDGKTVYTMSIIDMMSSMKQWIGCLEYPCYALSERIKNKVKKFNEEFRLTGDYWKGAFEADIYLCCMRADAAAEADITLEELSNLWGDLYDRLRTANSRAKNGVSFAKVTYGLEGTGAIAMDVKDMREDFGVDTSPDPARTAAEFADSVERENDINVGSYPLSTQEDELIKAIGLSIAAGCDEDPYFTEKWYQFLRFAGFYEISNVTVKALRDVRDKSNGLRGNFPGGPKTNFPAIFRREPIYDYDSDREVNYWVDSDYDADRLARILGNEWPEQNAGESLAGYYARMYASAV